MNRAAIISVSAAVNILIIVIARSMNIRPKNRQKPRKRTFPNLRQKQPKHPRRKPLHPLPKPPFLLKRKKQAARNGLYRGNFPISQGFAPNPI